MTITRLIVPAPLLSIALLAAWLVLSRSASLGNVILGAILAGTIPILVRKLRLTGIRVRNARVVLRFLLTVGSDVVKSNLAVAWGVIRWRARRPSSRFVVIPLELRDPAGLAALAMVTTIVPGTVWSELAIDRSAMLLHVWDVDEPEAFAARFKARYEQPLREIFE